MLDEFGGKAGTTLAVVDAGYDHLVHWMSPLDLEPEKSSSIDTHLFGSHHDILAMSLDGQTVSIARDTDPAKFRAMLANSDDEEPTR